MAIIINPDGTVSTIETTHDQYGNLRPKIDSEVMKEQEIHYNKNTLSETKENKGYIYPTGSASKKHKKKVIIGRVIPPKKQQLFISKAEINMFFKDRIASGKFVDTNEYKSIKSRLSEELGTFFASKYVYYLEKIKQINELEEAMRRTTFNKPKVKKKKKKDKLPHQVKEVKIHHNSHAGFTIGEIAKLGSLKENYTSSQDFEVRTSNPPRPARAPKYAYARDRYGRVQERDSFNEEKKNEFYSAQKRQSHYDYSSYDANDDHDGAYSDWD